MHVGMESACKTPPVVSSKRIVITEVRNGRITNDGSDEKITQACRDGFQGAFTSAIFTGQRVEGFSVVDTPIVFQRIRTGETTRRYRFIYVFGGSKEHREEQVKSGCSGIYSDRPDLIKSCLDTVDWSAQRDYRMVIPVPFDGGSPSTFWRGVTLSQSVTVTFDDNKHSVIVERLNNETSSQCAVRSCYRALANVINAPHQQDCVDVLTLAMRYEEEINSDTERARAREL